MSEVRIFTDGACKANGKKGAVASYAAYFPEHPEWSLAAKIPEDETQTNQRGELKAIHEGVKKVYESCGSPAETSIHIYTDSTYSRDCLTTWLPTWLKNNWKTAAGHPVIHRDLIEATTIQLPKFKSYIITYVKAHTGKTDELSRYNDVVDKMAVNVLIEPKEVKQISTTEGPFKDLPLTMMGAPLEETKVVEWCKTHLELLDQSALKTALFTAFQRTVHKNGYEVELQRMNKTRVVRLIAGTHLVKEGITIIKQE